MALEILFKPFVAIPVILLSCYLLFKLLTSKSGLPDLPCVDLDRTQWFAETRARIRTTLHFKDAIDYAYEHYSRKDQSCVLLNLSDTTILVPPSAVEWIISQPESDLSVLESHREVLQGDYIFADPSVLLNKDHHEHVVRTTLTRQLGSLTADIMDELATAIDETWGLDSQNWKEIVVFGNMTHIIARASNRVLVGLPLCRNADYLASAAADAQLMVPVASILRLFPKRVRQFISPLIVFPCKYFQAKTARFLEPEIKSRLARLDHQATDPEEKAAGSLPNDFLQWQISYARDNLPPVELTTRMIAGRTLALNFASIHTTTFGITNTLFDLISGHKAADNLAELREEAAEVLAADGGIWTRRGLSKLHKIDSAIRESLRVSSFLSYGLTRKVTAPGGITTPDGVHCPYGSSVAVSVRGIHADPTIGPDATTYDPFRYVNARDAIVADTETGKLDAESILKKANYGIVSTSADFLSFGHGRHACPGRFFAANELKLLLAYLVLNYDIEVLEKRPSNVWFSANQLPPMKATIKVRRRKATVGLETH